MLGITRTSIQWLAAELVVVVLGILIAFQIDEWREELANEERGISALESILIDLDIGEQQYDAWEASLLRSQELSEVWIRLIWQKRVPTADALQDALQFGQFRTHNWSPIATAFSGARESGDINHIRDTALKRRIVQYFDGVGPYQLELRLALQELEEEFLDLLRAETIPRPADDFFEGGVVIRELAVRPLDFPQNTELKERLLRTYRVGGVALNQVDRGKSELVELRTAIKAYLGER